MKIHVRYRLDGTDEVLCKSRNAHFIQMESIIFGKVGSLNINNIVNICPLEEFAMQIRHVTIDSKKLETKQNKIKQNKTKQNNNNNKNTFSTIKKKNT